MKHQHVGLVAHDCVVWATCTVLLVIEYVLHIVTTMKAAGPVWPVWQCNPKVSQNAMTSVAQFQTCYGRQM